MRWGEARKEELQANLTPLLHLTIKNLIVVAVANHQFDAFYDCIRLEQGDLLSSSSYTRLQLLLTLHESVPTNSSLSRLTRLIHILQCMNSASVSLTRWGVPPQLPSTLLQLWSSSQEEECQMMLHHFLFHALTGDHSISSTLATVVRAIAVSSSAHYTSHLPLPLSFNEPSRGVLNFILDYAFLVVAVQLQVGVSPAKIVSISGVLSIVLGGFSIEIQNSVIHFLLMGWEKNRGICGSAYGMVLSGIHWCDLRKEIIDDKIESIFAIAEKCLQTDPFCACQILANLAPAQPKAPILQHMGKSVLIALTQTSEPFTLVCLLRLLCSLVPSGITSAMVPQCLQSMLQQQSILNSNWHDEYCVIVARVMEGVVQIPIRRSDQSVIEKCYSSFLPIILHSSPLVQSLCLQPLTVFMRLN